MTSIMDSVTKLNQVGEKRYEALQSLGIETIYDLLHFFPFRYEDVHIRSIDELIDQDKVALRGRVLTPPAVTYYGTRKNRLITRLSVDNHVIQLVFFNQPYLKSKLITNETVVVYGRWDAGKQTLFGTKILMQKGENSDAEAVYHTNKYIKQQTIVNLVKQAVDKYKAYLPDQLPKEIMIQKGFMPHRRAVEQMHFPKTLQLHEQARQQLIYTEFFNYQYKLLKLKEERYKEKSDQVVFDNNQLKAFIQTIPFELTNAQKRVVNEICKDLLAPYTMSRLLQGDVGSGKTVVAAIAVVAVYTSGKQSSIMVPTEILAQQHFETMKQLLEPFGIRVALLTGQTTAKQRKELLHQLKNGTINCLIGTHALIQEDVYFNNLSLVIIDEQHRFGVNQRQKLEDKAHLPNILYMSATPIPRTLALAMYAQMDISTIDEMPQGRQPIVTKWAKESEMGEVLAFVQRQINIGRQAYVIAPLIEESESIDVANAYELFHKIDTFLPANIKVGLLHGKMTNVEKEATMEAFKHNQIHVLVSTTVIEVGVNVKNATVMVIQDADRFGLAQLHQLRGRVGRGDYQSFCYLIASPKTEEGKKRMKIMVDSTDGFYLAQQDLKMRGIGDLFGVNQSGLPQFKIGDVIHDEGVLLSARDDALTYILNETKKNNV